MRRSAAAFGFVAAGFGCNSIFGIDPTTLRPDAGPVQGLITQQQLTAIPDVVQFPPVDGLAKVQIGALDGPLGFIDVTDGAFVVPGDLANKPYRLVYQPEGDPIPHEVQWSFTTPHICIPFFGKPGQPPVPSNATMQITSTAGGCPTAPTCPTGFNAPLVFSYGTTWTAGAPTQASPGNPVNYEYSTNATALNGPLPTLQSGTDTEMLVDYDASGMATGGVRVKVDLVADTVVPTQGPWKTFSQTTLAFAPTTPTTGNRIIAAMQGVVGGPSVPAPMVYAGVLPSTSMPSLGQGPLPPKLDPLRVPMFALGAALDQTVGSMAFADPFINADALPLAIAFQVANHRKVDGIELYSGFQWVRLATQTDATTNLDASVVGIPKSPTLTDNKAADISLNEIDDTMSVTQLHLSGLGTTLLKFKLDMPADDCVATLYQLNVTGLGPIRSYEVVPLDLAVAIQIDTTVFTMGPKYVFGIVCRAGFPLAKTMGQLDQVSYPFSVSSVFPGSFIVQ